MYNVACCHATAFSALTHDHNHDSQQLSSLDTSHWTLGRIHAKTVNIPLDLCFDIIDAVSAGRHLDHLRRKTLQACARTCSAWLGRARFQLYHDVRWHLLDRPDIKTLGKFSDTIAAVPELGALVTHIDISIWGL